MAALWWLVPVLAALAAWLWVKWLRRLRTDAPGDPPVPLLGNLTQLGSGPDGLFRSIERMHAEHGPTFRLYLGHRLYVFVTDPRDLQLVLGSTKMVDRDPNLLSVVDIFIGNGLLTRRGNEWRAHRKIITPSFHLQILEQFLEVFNAGAKVLIERLGETCGREVDVFPVASLSTLEMIVETAMGSEADSQPAGGPSKRDFIAAVADSIRLIQELAVRPWLQVKWLARLTRIGRETQRNVATLRTFGDQVVARKRAQLMSGVAADQDSVRSGKKRRLPFLDMVLSSSEGLLTDREICDEVYTLISAGNDTTASALSFTLALLALHPEWQQAVHQELDAVYGEGENCHRPTTAQDLPKLQVLDRVIKESLRLFPPASLLPRHVPEDLVLPSSGYSLPRDSSVLVLSFFTHRNPDHFPDPGRFDPDRFLPENSAGRHPFCYVPFGAGLRNCVGSRFATMEMKTLLSAVLRAYRVLPVSTMEDLHRIALSIIIHPVDGMHVIFHKRHQHDRCLSHNVRELPGSSEVRLLTKDQYIHTFSKNISTCRQYCFVGKSIY